MNLHWTNTKINKLLASNANKLDRGCSCLFIPLSARTALKVYKRRHDRDYSFEGQQRAFGLGLAPMTGEKIDFAPKTDVHDKITGLAECAEPHNWYRIKTTNFYGYTTEIVDILPDGLTSEQRVRLCYDLETAGYSSEDVGCCHNAGLRKGKPVCYDFDPQSMGEPSF